jgi:hypothetical protein
MRLSPPRLSRQQAADKRWPHKRWWAFSTEEDAHLHFKMERSERQGPPTLTHTRACHVRERQQGFDS